MKYFQWSSPLAYPNKSAATVLMTRPMNVSTFGEIFVSARPRTIAYNSTLLAFPNALVHVILRLCLHPERSEGTIKKTNSRAASDTRILGARILAASCCLLVVYR